MAEESEAASSEYVELAELLEESVSRADGPASDAVDEIRLRLVQLYLDTLKDPGRAAGHLETLLQRPEPSSFALDAGAALLEIDPLAPRMAELLAAAYRRLGRIASEASTLTAELKLAQGPRLDQVRRRLADIRFRELEDGEGALELLEPVLASEPGDDELRRQYIEIAKALDRRMAAAELLSRALQSMADPAARGRVGFDVGTLFLQEGELPLARAAFLDVVRGGSRDEAALSAARRLIDLEPDPGDAEILEPSLELLVEATPDPSEREQAVQRLVGLRRPAPAAAPSIAQPEARAFVGEEPPSTEASAPSELPAAAEPSPPLEATPAAEPSPPLEATPAAEPGPPLEAQEAEPSPPPEAPAAVEPSPPPEAPAAVEPSAQPERPPTAKAITKPETPLSQEQVRRFELDAARVLARDPATLDRAIEAYQAWFERFGEDTEARREWLQLLERAERWPDLALALEAQLERSPPAVRAGIWARLGQLRWKRLGGPAAALAAFRHSLAIDRENALSLRCAEKLMAEGEWRLLAAEVLEGAYRGKPSPQGLARVYETRALLETEPQLRLEALEARFQLLGESTADARRGIDLCRRAFNEACDHAPESLLKWLSRLDKFAERLGDAELPLERLVRYETALGRAVDPEQRRDLLLSIGGQRRALGDLPGAIGIYRRIVDEDPTAAAAHEALIEATAEFGEEAGSFTAIDRALEHLQGPAQHPIVLRKAAILARRGEGSDALELCRALLDEPDLAPATLEAIAELAHDEDDRELYHQALAILTQSGDAEARKRALERLGDFQFEQMNDPRAAVESWKPAAQLYEGDPAEEEHARQLYERVLEALPDDRDAALRLVALYAQLGEWAKVPEAFAVLVRAGDDPTRAVNLLLELEKPALEAGAVAELVSMVDEALWRLGPDSTEQASRLKRARARALASDPMRETEASQAFRDLIESFESQSDVGDFTAFVDSRPGAEDRHKDRRWLFEWRLKRGADRVGVLTAWAKEEEEYDDLPAAILVYERLAEADPENGSWRETLCRLKLRTGDFEGGLSALHGLRSRSDFDPQRKLELSVARMLVEELARPVEAAEVLALALAVDPRIEEAHTLMQHLLADPAFRDEIAERLELIAEKASPAETLAILEQLAAAYDDVPVPDPRRGRWFERILELGPKDPAWMAASALRGVLADPSSMSLWDAAERLAGDLGQADRVIDAYHRALTERVHELELAEALGRRLIAFADRYSADSARLATALERVLVLAPGARWALDRVKLVWTSQARWDELLASYDRAIFAAPTDEERGQLLDEASLAARDLAGSAERAIGYLEALHQLKPNDGSVEASLERLYQRQGYHDALLRMLGARMEKSTDFKRREVQRRIIALRIDLEQCQLAEAALEQMFSEGTPLSEVADLLERIVELRSADALPGREYALSLLKRHYAEAGQIADVIRLTGLELGMPRDERRRAHIARELVRLRLAAEPPVFAETLSAIEAQLGDDAALLKVAYETLLQRALQTFKRSGDAASDAKTTILRLLPALTHVLVNGGRALRAVRLLEHAGRLPFERGEQRLLLVRAATLASERLQDRSRALDLLRKIFAEEAGDAAASSAIALLVELLSQSGLGEELKTVVRSRALALHRDGGGSAVVEQFAAEARDESREARRAVLSEAAQVLAGELREPAHAVILLQLAQRLEPNDAQIRLSLADALDALGRGEDAIQALRAGIEQYGDQRPKERALLHHRLAQQLSRGGREQDALLELRLAAEMHSTHPVILHEFGRAALAQNQLEAAESAYRGLAMALRQPALEAPGLPALSEVYLDLSEIAQQKNEGDRAADLLDSAFESAFEAAADPRRFQQSLADRGRFDLVFRAVARRFASAQTPRERALSLADLVAVWDEHLGRSEQLGATIREKVEVLTAELEREPLLDAQAWDALSAALARTGDKQRFVALLEPALPRIEASARRPLQLVLARAYLEEPARTSDAISVLDALLAETPDDGEALELLSAVLEREGRLEHLAKLLQQRLKLLALPDDAARFAELSLLLGGILERTGKSAEALPVYEAILDHGPADAKTLSPLAERLAALESERLIDCLEWLVEWDPAPVPALARGLLDKITPAGDGQRTRRVLELGFAADAGDPVFRNPLLEDYTSRGEWGHALGLLQRALESRKSDRAILRQLIDTQHRSGDDRAALQTLDTALSAEPEDVELLGVRAGLREGLGDEDGAVEDLERARAIDADFSDPLLELLQRIADKSAPGNDSHAIKFVDLLLETGQTGRARSELERLLARTPNHKEALRRIATLASSEGDWELATSAYHELFPLLDGTDELRSVALALAETCELAGRVADARAPLERALELSPDDPVIEDKLEQVYQSNADFSGLARLITKRAERANEPGERTRMLVRAARVLLEQADDVHRALSTLERIRTEQPHDLETNLLWARVQRKLGHAERVLEPLRETLNANRGKRTPLVASAQLEIAHAHLVSDDLFEALDALKAGFNLDRKNVELALLLGLVALDLDDEKTAERALLSAISPPAQGAEAVVTAATRATAFYQLAALAYAKGDLARARRMAGKATSEEPSHEGARALLEVLAPRAVATG